MKKASLSFLRGSFLILEVAEDKGASGAVLTAIDSPAYSLEKPQSPTKIALSLGSVSLDRSSGPCTLAMSEPLASQKPSSKPNLKNREALVGT